MCGLLKELFALFSKADVAELVDALVSGISDSNVMGVQVSPSALSLVKTNNFLR